METPLKINNKVDETRTFYGWCGKHQNYTMMKITNDPGFKPEEFVRFCPICGHLLVFTEKREERCTIA